MGFPAVEYGEITYTLEWHLLSSQTDVLPTTYENITSTLAQISSIKA